MKTLNALLFLVVIACFTGCKKENDTTTFIVKVNYEFYLSGHWDGKNYNTFPVEGAIVYIFNDINLNYPIIMGYEYIGDGKLKNKSSGAIIPFSEKRTTDGLGLLILDNYQNGTYAIIADISNLDKNNILGKAKQYQGSSVSIPSPSMPGYDANLLKIDFDIYPWMPSDIGK